MCTALSIGRDAVVNCLRQGKGVSFSRDWVCSPDEPFESDDPLTSEEASEPENPQEAPFTWKYVADLPRASMESTRHVLRAASVSFCELPGGIIECGPDCDWESLFLLKRSKPSKRSPRFNIDAREYEWG